MVLTYPSPLGAVSLMLPPDPSHVRTNTATAAVSRIALRALQFRDQTHTVHLAHHLEAMHMSIHIVLPREIAAARPYPSAVVHEALRPSGQETVEIATEEELAHHHLEEVVS